MTIIEINNIKKSFKNNNKEQPVLKGIDLKIAENEKVAIIGPSGSGKTTLLNIIGLLQEYDEGQVIVDGVDGASLNDKELAKFRNKEFGYIVQDYALLEDENVYDNVKIPLEYQNRIKRSAYRQHVLEAIKKVGLEDKAKMKVKKLSGGERQRVAIARALVCDQKIILADEPTGSLDSENKEKILQLLLETNKTLLMVTHDVNLIDKFDRVITLKDGVLSN